MDGFSQSITEFSRFFDAVTIGGAASRGLLAGTFFVVFEYIWERIFPWPGSLTYAIRAAAKLGHENAELERAAAIATGNVAVLRQQLADITGAVRPGAIGSAPTPFSSSPVAPATGVASSPVGLPPMPGLPPLPKF